MLRLCAMYCDVCESHGKPLIFDFFVCFPHEIGRRGCMFDLEFLFEIGKVLHFTIFYHLIARVLPSPSTKESVSQ